MDAVVCKEWSDRIRLRVLALPSFLLALVVLGGFRLCTVVACCGALTGGYYFAKLINDYSNGFFLWNFFEYLLNDKLSTPVDLEQKDELKASSAMESNNAMPWEGLYISEPVNECLEELIEQLIDNYINSWYKSEISSDAAFVNEIRYQIRYASAVALRKIFNIDLSEVILTEAVPIAVVHCERVNRIGSSIDKHIFPPQMVETKILEAMDDVHYALSSRQSELNYLRQVADHLVAHLVDESRVAGRSSDDDSPILSQHTTNRSWPSHSCRHFLRELVVFSFLLPILDLIADPDTINHLLILLFDPEPLNRDPGDKADLVPLLHGLTDFAHDNAPDSLLQLKLSEILRDSRQLSMFTMYLKDIRGPTNELYFLLHSGDVHERMLGVQRDDESTIAEIQYDIWEIFSKYVHEAAPDRVSLPDELFQEFREAVENKDIELIDPIEKAYQLVYKRLQRDYVIPFCQSECYLGHLCGSPPVSVDELITVGERSNLGKRLTVPGNDSSFSLSQFRNRLWKVIMPTSTEGSTDSSFERLSDLGSLDSSSLNSQIEVANDASLVAGYTPNAEYTSQFEHIPSIDVTFDGSNGENSDDLCVVRVSPVSAANSEEYPERRSGSGSPSELTIFDPQRDMNRWIITIPRIEPRRDANGRTMYVYVVCVERFDSNDCFASSHSSSTGSQLNKWSVIRRYNEFYVLESKLLEFHGDLIKTDPLPPRRPFANKSRAFIESQRIQFERFVRLLARQSILKRSDLLFTFLTSEQELKDNIQLSDLNPWNVVRKMPSKFARERGQNLKPFLLSLLANTLAPQPEVGTASFEVLSRGERSESSSLSSFNMEGSSRPREALINTIYGNNCPSARICLATETPYVLWTRSVTKSVLFLLNGFFSVSRWLFSLLASIRSLLGRTLDAATTVLLRRVLRIAFLDVNCIRMIRLIQDALFAGDTLPSTEQEKMLRSELAQRRTLEYLQEELPAHLIKAVGQKRFRHGIQTLFQTLQYPRLNKHLSYILLDILIEKLIPTTEQ